MCAGPLFIPVIGHPCLFLTTTNISTINMDICESLFHLFSFPLTIYPKVRWLDDHSIYFFFERGPYNFPKWLYQFVFLLIEHRLFGFLFFFGFCFLLFFTHILCHHSLEKLNFRLELVITSYTILASLWVIESGHSVRLCINNQENWSVQKAIFSKVSKQVSNNSNKILLGGKVPLS